MNLSFEERHSALWLKIRTHAEAEIQRHRIKNDGQHDDITTANIRGRIAALKELIALEEDRSPLADE